MIVEGKTANIIDSVISYESGISWKSANKYMEAIDYEIGTDHLSAKISIHGSVAEITDFRKNLPEVSSELSVTFSDGEHPFGPAFACESERNYLLIGIDDIATTGKGVAQMSFQLAAMTIPPWAHSSIIFNLANFAVQEIRRESGEDKTVSQTEEGWSAFAHGWSRPKFTLSLLANAQIMGRTIRWILERRTESFTINCNQSMMLLDSSREEVLCLSFGNLHRLGNSNFWQADFDFVRVEEYLYILTERRFRLATEKGNLLTMERSWQTI